MSALMKAIASLRPGVDCADTDGTLAGIRWDTAGVVPPTEEEIATEIARPAPITVSRLRFKLELDARGMLPKVEEAVKAAGSTPLLYWQEATEFESDHPLVQQIGAGLGLSPADIRAMFESAAARDA